MYTNLRRVCELIEEDNGGFIHEARFGIDIEFDKRFNAALAEWPRQSLEAWDAWVGQLDEDEKWTLAAGEEGERDAMFARMPNQQGTALDEFFNMFFEGVEDSQDTIGEPSYHVG